MALMSMKELFKRLPSDGVTCHALRNFNIGMMGPSRVPSVKELATTLGFDILLREMRQSERGRLVSDPFSNSGYRIEVNSSDDVRTQRWTVLHEIMHGLLHKKDDPLAFDQYRAGRSHFYTKDELAEEREANGYTEALVFGDGALQAALSIYGRDEEKLAWHFGVSVPTLVIAMAKLN